MSSPCATPSTVWRLCVRPCASVRSAHFQPQHRCRLRRRWRRRPPRKRQKGRRSLIVRQHPTTVMSRPLCWWRRASRWSLQRSPKCSAATVSQRTTNRATHASCTPMTPTATTTPTSKKRATLASEHIILPTARTPTRTPDTHAQHAAAPRARAHTRTVNTLPSCESRLSPPLPDKTPHTGMRHRISSPPDVEPDVSTSPPPRSPAHRAAPTRLAAQNTSQGLQEKGIHSHSFSADHRLTQRRTSDESLPAACAHGCVHHSRIASRRIAHALPRTRAPGRDPAPSTPAAYWCDRFGRAGLGRACLLLREGGESGVVGSKLAKLPRQCCPLPGAPPHGRRARRS